MKENNFEIQLEEKIAEMEDNNYEFPKRFSKTDYLFAIGAGLFCFVTIIIGAFF